MIVASTPKKAPCREADPWIALSYFDLLAQANGLGTCWSGFAVHAFKGMRGIRKVLNMPRGYEVGAVLLFGVPAVEYARVPHPRPMSVEVQ
jgi:nitroreductase